MHPMASKFAKRGKRGFTATGSLVSERIRTATGKRGFSQTRLLTDWPAIAGEAIAQVARPVKVGYARQGFGATLTLLVEGAHAPMVQMQLPTLIERVNACYGYAAISRIHIAQTAASGFAEDKASFVPASRDITAQERKRVSAQVAGVADPGLQQALSRLGENIVKRHPKGTPQ